MPQETIAVVIPAGGGGTRLWPRSRQSTPKQFIDIVSERTMLQETVDRVDALVPKENVFVITNAKHLGAVREQMPEVPSANVIGEPQGRDSAPAIGLMAALLESRLGPEATMVVLPADHVILDAAKFREILQMAATVAQDGYLVTLGIPPTNPDTGFGYIQSGDVIHEESSLGLTARAVKQFKEKPNKEVAEQYLREGNYFWNAGMFIATVRTLRELFQTHLPQFESGFAQIVEAQGTPNAEAVLNEIFPTFDKISIDYAIVEKADRVAVIPAEIGWNDVGSWARLAEVLTEEGNGSANVVMGQHIGVDTSGSLIYSPHKLVATIGLDEFIVIDTPEALLICPKSRSEDVKKIVDALKERGDHHLL